eukprot:scaffold28814_cov71-Phaeocystis_antarctica.AAC.1
MGSGAVVLRIVRARTADSGRAKHTNYERKPSGSHGMRWAGGLTWVPGRESWFRRSQPCSNGSGLLFAEVLLRDWKFFSALQPSSIRFDSIRFDCRRPLPRVPRGVHFHLHSGANPHPSQ